MTVKPKDLLPMWLRENARDRRRQEKRARKAYTKGPLKDAGDALADAHAAAAEAYERALERALDAMTDPPSACADMHANAAEIRASIAADAFPSACERCDNRGWFYAPVDSILEYGARYCDCDAGKSRREADGIAPEVGT